jgi:hypothetical protein
MGLTKCYTTRTLVLRSLYSIQRHACGFRINSFHYDLTVGLLETRTGRSSSVLFRFTPTRIADQHVTIIIDQSLTQFILGLFVHVFPIVRHDGSGNRRPDGVRLRNDTTTLDADADIQIGEFVLANNQHRFVHLQPHDFGFDVFDGLAIDFDQTAALLGKGNRCGRLFPVVIVGRMLVEGDALT